MGQEDRGVDGRGFQVSVCQEDGEFNGIGLQVSASQEVGEFDDIPFRQVWVRRMDNLMT